MQTRIPRCLAALACLVFTLLLTGCPYHSDVPIDAPLQTIDRALLGTWREANSSTETPVYEIRPEGDREYQISARGDNETVVYRGHLTFVGENQYLNLREDGADTRYWLFRVEGTEDNASVTLRPVTENITERFAQSQDLFAFVEKNQGLSFFFEGPTQYLRVSP